MRFIIGALSGIIVLLVGAVAFTALNPLPARDGSTGDRPGIMQGAAPQVGGADTAPAAEVTRTEQALPDTSLHPAPSAPQALPDTSARPAKSASQAQPDTSLRPDQSAPQALPEATLDTLPAPAEDADARAPLSDPPMPIATASPTATPDPAGRKLAAIDGSTPLRPAPADIPATNTPPAEGPTLATPAPQAEAPALPGPANGAALPLPTTLAALPAVSDTPPAPPVIDTSAAPRVYVIGERVNMRAGPGSRHDWLASLTRGTGLTLIEKRGRWYKVETRVDGQLVTGWMAAAFLSDAPLDT